MTPRTCYSIMAAFGIGFVSLALGCWFWHPSLGPLALTCLPMIAMFNGIRRGSTEGTGWVFLSILLAVSAIFFAGFPTYPTRVKIAASVERCVPAKGAIKPCLDEAKTLYDYDVNAGSLAEVDWRKAFEGCIRVSGVRTCAEDFGRNGVTGEGVVTSDDIAAICAGEESRTVCLLDLAAKGYPFNAFKVLDDGKVADVAAAQKPE